ncbi:DUF1573 domain-containing protein [Proteiniborus sp. MB09-C3]|uniref:DUF1573 domain-containing protein n=1 Tax=Proteiniborus sp. MB09-C3 TaxID=3050072 RepID=UPI0025539AD9|nr:DUF1573 domain-containing protein [Proteiniborus sp. MB09-C3]WIV13114.1 DUF1573 domain-containing protein [Proteiniborus sp. MB09-C3]
MDSDNVCNSLQKTVSNVLIRHKSILDIITKLEESNSRINRAIVKSATSCGCISINATKQDYSQGSFVEIKDSLKNHIEGELCDNCREKIEEEIGNHMFYIASLCNSFDLNLGEITSREMNKLKTLGIYSLL